VYKNERFRSKFRCKTLTLLYNSDCKIIIYCLTYGKVCVLVCLGDGLDKVGRLAEVVGLQLLLQGSIRGLREQGLFLQYCQDTCAKYRLSASVKTYFAKNEIFACFAK
jgi:hypothetical protein